MRAHLRSLTVVGAVTMLLVAVVTLSVAKLSVAKDENPLDATLKSVPAVFSVVPDSALAVQVLNNPERAAGRLSTLADRFGKPEFQPMAMLKLMVDGVDFEGAVAIAWFTEKEQTTPVAVFFASLTDFEKFHKRAGGQEKKDGVWTVQLGNESFLAAEKNGFAILAPPENEELLDRVLAAQESLFDDVAGLKFWKANHDVGSIVTPHGIKTFSELAVGKLDEMKKQLAAVNDPQVKAAAGAIEIYKQIAAKLGDELSFLAAGAVLDDGGSVRMNARLQFTQQGSLAKLGAIAPPDQNLLSGLPHEDYMIAGGATFSKKFVEWMLDSSLKMMKEMPELYGEVTDEQIKQLQETWKMMADWNGIAMRFSAPEPGETMMSAISGVMRVGDAKKFLDDYLKAMSQYAELMANADNPAVPEMKSEKVQIGKIAAVKMVMKMQVPPGPAAQMIEKIYGPGGEVTAYLAAADDKTVVIVYSSEDALERAVQNAVKPGLSVDKQIAKTSAMLIDEPHSVGYLSARGTMQFFEYLVTLMPPGLPIPDLPPFPDVAPVGMAVKMSGTHMDAELVVPDEFLSAVADYIDLVKQQQLERFQEF